MEHETVKYVAYHVLALAAGLAMFIAGLRVFVRGVQAHESFEYKSVKIGGSSVVIVIGLALILGPFHFDVPSRAPQAGTAPSPSGPPPTGKVFKTPRGVVCSTFTTAAGGNALGCVVTQHEWGNRGCQYLFTLEETGAPQAESCPAPATLIRLYGYPAKDRQVDEYGSTFDMGVATCELTAEFTECTNSDGEYLRVALDQSVPRVR